MQGPRGGFSSSALDQFAKWTTLRRVWGLHEDAVPFVDAGDALLIMARVRRNPLLLKLTEVPLVL